MSPSENLSFCYGGGRVKEERCTWGCMSVDSCPEFLSDTAYMFPGQAMVLSLIGCGILQIL